MAHHAYLYVGGKEAGIAAARAFLATRGLTGTDNPDISVFSYEGLFSVEDARRIVSLASQASVAGKEKALILATERIFHESQNALLKTFEEPPEGTILILIIPAEGVLLPTLRSRLVQLPATKEAASPEAEAFLRASQSEREKIVARLLTRTKDAKDEEKQAARMEAMRLCQGLMVAISTKDIPEREVLLSELSRFMPILHTSSAPLKLIFEHLLIVLPKGSGK